MGREFGKSDEQCREEDGPTTLTEAVNARVPKRTKGTK